MKNEVYLEFKLNISFKTILFIQRISASNGKQREGLKSEYAMLDEWREQIKLPKYFDNTLYIKKDQTKLLINKIFTSTFCVSIATNAILKA